MTQRRSITHRVRTEKLCGLCRRPIPHGTVASVTTTKDKDGNHTDAYVCWRCANPYD